jgi:hypothetical protein
MSEPSSGVNEGTGSSSAQELYIEFDGRQLITRTDVPILHEFLKETFRHMLVPCVTDGVGTLDVFGEKDAYRLESAETRVIAGQEVDYLLNRVKEEVRFEFMRARRDLLWLHAAAVERDGSAMLLCGRSGQGKSTLSSLLCDRGWRLMSDDIAPVRMDANEVLPFCQSPVRRIPRDRKLEPHKRKGLVRQKVALLPDQLRRDPAAIRSMVFLTFSAGAPSVVGRLTQGETALEVLRNLTNFIDHKAGAVERAAVMARSLPGFSLSYGSSAEAAGILDTLA